MNLLLIFFSALFLIGNLLVYKHKLSEKVSYSLLLGMEFFTFIALYSSGKWAGANLSVLTQVYVLICLLTTLVYLIPKYLEAFHPLVWVQVAFLVQLSTFMLFRIEPLLARRHIIISLLGLATILPVYWVVKHFKTSYRFSLLYYFLAVTLLALTNETKYGATNWIKIGNLVFQPSEIVKILFSLFLASFLLTKYSLKKFISASIMSFLVIGILVLQKDLGGAFIFFTIYVVITYMYSHNKVLLFGQFVLAGIGAGVSVWLFTHVKVRIISWLHPFDYADKEGFQIIRSLQALINGKWLGTGLGNGNPSRIPVVTSDFLFAAIGEEFGSVFLILLVLHFCFFVLMLYNQCLKARNKFYFYTGTSLTTMLAIQGFLIMAGSTGMIPLTGVVLPFVSYGGSAMIGNFLIVGMIESMSKCQLQKLKQIKDIEEQDIEVRQIRGLSKYIRILKYFILLIYGCFILYLVWLFGFWELPVLTQSILKVFYTL